MAGRSAFIALVCALVLLAGCGEDEEAEPEPRAPAATRLEITSSLSPDRTITCPGARECARLEKLEQSDFAPVPDDVGCTQIYGGPETATVSGTLRGRRVKAEFSRQNGCEIGRWDRLAWLLGRP
jgi:hypothetical protein